MSAGLGCPHSGVVPRLQVRGANSDLPGRGRPNNGLLKQRRLHAERDQPGPAGQERDRARRRAHSCGIGRPVLEETARLAREGRKELESDPREHKPAPSEAGALVRGSC
jgi:hypothetical protein